VGSSVTGGVGGATDTEGGRRACRQRDLYLNQSGGGVPSIQNLYLNQVLLTPYFTVSARRCPRHRTCPADGLRFVPCPL
jgi:hypothetical protein